MTSRQLRLLRGTAASSVATIIAAVSHTIGGGAPPHPLLVLALSVFLTPLAALVVGRRLNLLGLSAAVAMSQTIFHVLFVALNATATGTGTAGHAHHLVASPSPLPLTPITTVSADTGMLGAHIIAALVTTAMLWRGERMLLAIADWVRAALRRRMPQIAAEWPMPTSRSEVVVRAAHLPLAHDISRRGPPLIARG